LLSNLMLIPFLQEKLDKNETKLLFNDI